MSRRIGNVRPDDTGRQRRSQQTTAEWTIFGMSAALILAVVAVLVVEWLGNPSGPPRFSTSVKTVRTLDGTPVALVAGAAFAVREEPTRAGQGVGAIARRADRLMGERVTVTGRIRDVVSAKSFTLTEDKRILVLDVSAVPAIDNNLDGALRTERVQVWGVLERFDIEEAESSVGEPSRRAV